MRDLEGKVVIVTGGASGIGRAAALALADARARVVVADVDGTGGAAVVEDATSRGADARFVKTDVAHAGQVRALVADAVDAFGRVDAAFNAAGVLGAWAPVGDADEHEFDRVMNVNVRGTFLSMREEIRRFVAQGSGGAIVNASSVAGLSSFREQSAYAASKHAVVGLTRTAALEYATQGIRVNAVCPGVIDTPMTRTAFGEESDAWKEAATWHPVGRVGTPEEVANAALWLLSDASSFTTGTTLVVDGGMLAE